MGYIDIDDAAVGAGVSSLNSQTGSIDLVAGTNIALTPGAGTITISAAGAATFTGDTGTGGTSGIVPAPPAGSKAAGDFLSATGAWAYVDQSKPISNPFSLISQTSNPVGSTKSQTITLYTGITGKQYAVVAGGGSASTMAIWDISDQAIPVLCSNTLLAGSYSIDVSTISGAVYAFIGSSGSRSVYIYDITNPFSPVQKVNFPIVAVTTSIYGVKYVGGYLYCATQNQGLVVLDVGGGASGGTLTAPVVSYNEQVTLGGNPKSFGVTSAVISGTTYIFTTQFITSIFGTRQIKSWSISTPQTPALLQSLQVTTVGEPLGVSISGNTACVTVSASGVNVYNLVDVTNPSSMTNLSVISNPSGFSVNSGFTGVINGNYLFTPWGSNASLGGQIQMFDITNRSSPIAVASVNTNVATAVFGGIAISGGYIYCGDYGVAPGSTGTLDIFQMPFTTMTAGAITTSTIQTTSFISKNGHLKSIQTTVPTVLPNVNAGTGATSSLSNATDVAGNITLNAGSASVSAGVQIAITFNQVYNVAPIVILTPTNTNVAGVAYYITSSTTGFTISFNLAPTISTTYTWSYHCIETQ